MKRFTWLLIALLFTGLLVACGSTAKAPDLTDVTSYYVRADGNDRNAGTSEDVPFKTLAKALDAASKTSLKKITVIGTLVGQTSTERLPPNIQKKTVKKLDGNPEDIARVMANQIGVVELEGSYDEKHPYEILITGKPDAVETEKARLTSNTDYVLVILNNVIRLENIEISGHRGKAVIAVLGGELTLGKGVKITQNKGDTVVGINTSNSILIMRDDAEVSYNEGAEGAGIALENGSVGILLDNALVTHNKTASSGGGILVDGSTLIMKDNATVSNNSASEVGGGIMTFYPKKNGYISQITIADNATVTNNSADVGGGIALFGARLIMKNNATVSNNNARGAGCGIITYTATEIGEVSRITITDNAAVIKNSAGTGGGIYLQDKLILEGNARITENTASARGGGIIGPNTASVEKGKNVILENNQAPAVPDSIWRFE